MLNIFHPRMQDAMLARAVAAGAIVRRGTHGDRRPRGTWSRSIGDLRVWRRRTPRGVGAHRRRRRRARVAGARWAGSMSCEARSCCEWPACSSRDRACPSTARTSPWGPASRAFWAPQGGGRARTYFVYPGATGDRQSTGKQNVSEFLRAVESAGVPSSWLSGVESIGPLAEFEAADRHVKIPAKHGVVLIGDAAGASDPSWGSGLSLTLLDVEHLADALRTHDDWNDAISRYAHEHDRYYDALHRIHRWMTELAWTPGPEADARRARVLPKWIAQVDGFPDLVGLGPFGPSDERAMRITLGLD